MSALSYNQAIEGNNTLFGNYQSTQGQRVLDSLNPATYPGDQNRAAELGVAGGTAVLVAVGVGAAAKYVIKYASTVDAAIADVLGVGKGSTAAIPGFTATESKIIYETNNILRSSEVAKIEEAFNTGKPITVTIGGRMIQYEPSLPASGMTMFGENGFLIGPEAFTSSAEFEKTILHELYRLNTSISAGGVSAELAAQETKAAYDFAQKASQLVTKGVKN